MTERQKAYREYLKGKHWEGLRVRALERDGGRCVKCSGEELLEVHHRRYRTPWESCVLEDVETMCWGCHRKEHGFEVWEYGAFDEALELLRKRMRRLDSYAALPGEEEIGAVCALCTEVRHEQEIEAVIRERAGLRIIFTSSEAWNRWLEKGSEISLRLWPWAARKRKELQAKYVRQTL